jgi:A/G-specific adenine glycosylase
MPADNGVKEPAAIVAMVRQATGLTVDLDRQLTRIRHAYTHFKLTGDVYLCRHVAGRVRVDGVRSHRWVSLGSLARLPMHKANHKFMKALKAALADSPAA